MDKCMLLVLCLSVALVWAVPKRPKRPDFLIDQEEGRSPHRTPFHGQTNVRPPYFGGGDDDDDDRNDNRRRPWDNTNKKNDGDDDDDDRYGSKYADDDDDDDGYGSVIDGFFFGTSADRGDNEKRRPIRPMTRPARPRPPLGFENADERAELLDYDVVEIKNGYEVRRYPASKWVCTEDTIDLDDDPYKYWQDEYEDGQEAVADVMSKGDQDKMFMKLFGYIIGVNSEAEEIAMTRPVTVKRTRLVRNRERHEMCFWTGTPWARRDLPEPLKPGVYIQEREPMEVFVKQYGGWMLSHDDWQTGLEDLANAVTDRFDVDTSGMYFTVSYNGPYTKEEDRRNEVWILKTKPSTDETSPFVNNRNVNKDLQSADERAEHIDYNVIEKERDYEIRSYPSSKWACTSTYDVDAEDDPLDNWQTDFKDNPFALISSARFEDSPLNQMFMRLYKYALGLNEDFKEFELTRPFTIKHTPKRRGDQESEEMCFWLGSENDRKRNLPKPIDRKVYIKERDEMTVFVRQFSGYALSHDDFLGHYEELKRDIRGKLFDPDILYTVMYSSPLTIQRRRNEVWIQVL